MSLRNYKHDLKNLVRYYWETEIIPNNDNIPKGNIAKKYNLPRTTPYSLSISQVYYDFLHQVPLEGQLECLSNYSVQETESILKQMDLCLENDSNLRPLDYTTFLKQLTESYTNKYTDKNTSKNTLLDDLNSKPRLLELMVKDLDKSVLEDIILSNIKDNYMLINSIYTAFEAEN